MKDLIKLATELHANIGEFNKLAAQSIVTEIATHPEHRAVLTALISSRDALRQELIIQLSSMLQSSRKYSTPETIERNARFLAKAKTTDNKGLLELAYEVTYIKAGFDVALNEDDDSLPF